MSKKTFGIGLVLLLGGVIGGALAALWVLRNVDMHLSLVNQPAWVRIPDPVSISAHVLDDLEIEIDTAITTTVPVDQRIQIPLTDTLHIQASFDNEIPIRMTVPVRDKIVIDQVLDIDTVIKADLLGDTHDLPIRGKIPVKATVPIRLNIPVDQNVRLTFQAPVDVRLKQALDVPLRADIHATIPIQSRMRVPVKSALTADVTIPDITPIIITEADLNLPLNTLRFDTADDDAATDVPAGAAP